MKDVRSISEDNGSWGNKDYDRLDSLYKRQAELSAQLISAGTASAGCA